MLRTAVRLIRLTEAAADFKQKIYNGYRSLVPPHYRAAARWVWGISALSSVLWFQGIPDGVPLAAHFYDVGQGDAIHVRTAQGFDVLIDGGPSARVVENLGRTLPFWDRTIELMILTHPHADHVVGLISVLKQFKVERVLATGALHTTDEYIAWLEEIKRQKIPLTIAKAGQVWTLERRAARAVSQLQGSSSAPTAVGAADAPNAARPRSQPASLAVLWPQEDFSGERVQEEKVGEGGGLNDTSIVIRLIYGQTSFLLMGDATSAVERELLSSQSTVHGSQCDGNTKNCSLKTDDSRLRADVLKVGHHGSKFSTSREFLQAVQPRYAVIQSGAENRYGHPAFATLWRLKQAGVKVLRNDQDGEVVLESDGMKIRIR